MNDPKPLSPAALRRRAVFLPAVVVLAVWFLNVTALRTQVGPQEPGFWMTILVLMSGVLVLRLWRRAEASGVSVSKTALTAIAATVGWFFLSGALPELGREPNVKVGNRGPMDRGGGGFTMSISREFHRPHVESLLARAEQFGPSGAFAEFAGARDLRAREEVGQLRG